MAQEIKLLWVNHYEKNEIAALQYYVTLAAGHGPFPEDELKISPRYWRSFIWLFLQGLIHHNCISHTILTSAGLLGFLFTRFRNVLSHNPPILMYNPVLNSNVSWLYWMLSHPIDCLCLLLSPGGAHPFVINSLFDSTVTEVRMCVFYHFGFDGFFPLPYLFFNYFYILVYIINFFPHLLIWLASGSICSGLGNIFFYLILEEA